MPKARVQKFHRADQHVQPALNGLGAYHALNELRPFVFQNVGFAGPAVQRVFNFLVRAAYGVGVVLQHGLVHIPVLDQSQQLACPQLAADVADHLHQLLFGQQAVLHALGKAPDGLHGVNDLAGGLGRFIRSRGVLSDHVPQPGDLPGGPRHALVDLGFRVPHDVQHQCPERTGRFAAAPLGHGGDRTDGRRQFVDPHMGLCRHRGHGSQALRQFFNAGGVLVVDLVGTVQHLGQCVNVSLVLIRRIHGQQELLCRFRIGVAHQLCLGGQLRQRVRLFAVTGTGKRRHRVQIFVRRLAVGRCRLIGPVPQFLHLLRCKASYLADRHHLIVHGLHGRNGVPEGSNGLGDDGAHYLPLKHFQVDVGKTVP